MARRSPLVVATESFQASADKLVVYVIKGQIYEPDDPIVSLRPRSFRELIPHRSPLASRSTEMNVRAATPEMSLP